MGLPWFTYPIQLHSSRMSMYSLGPEGTAYVSYFWRNWYTADWAYAQTTVIAICLGLLIVMFAQFMDTLDRLPQTPDVLGSTAYRRSKALLRSTTKQLSIGKWRIMTLGAFLFALLVTTYTLLLTLAPQPYSWPNLPGYGNSPPLGTRTGWMAMAFLPFIFALGAKRNFVSVLTGISHERLQIAHQYFGYAMFFTAVIHTLLLSIIRAQRGTLSWSTSIYWWSGVAALVPQTWLTFASLTPVRHRAYEIFKFLHFLSAAVFIVFLFIHCQLRLTVFDYFVATAVVYVPSLVWRLYGIIKSGSSMATVEELSPGLLHVRVPTKLKWTPGQHVFVRFGIGLHTATSHPFTLASMMLPGEAHFVIRVHGGITARLAKLAQAGRTVRTWLDGPYGGLGFDLRNALFDHVVLLAGGTGLSYMAPMLETIVEAKEAGRAGWQSAAVIISVREIEALKWVEPTLEAARKAGIHISVHVTTSQSKLLDDNTPAIEKAQDAHLSRERPDLTHIVKSAFSRAGSTLICSCGPEDFNVDVGNAHAAGQLAIARGRAVAEDVVLQHELFSM